MTIALTHFAARAGDHNDRAMFATPILADVLSNRLGTYITIVGEPQPASPTGWDQELALATPTLREMATRYDQLLTRGHRPVTVLSRCAVALATLPMIARHRPDAVVLWFDAHADLNTPENTTTGYLGGLALSGPLGLWDSGLGSGLAEQNAILVGARDIDQPEQELIDTARIGLVPVGPHMAEELRRIIAGRPVYVHIDCDVLEPGTVPTDYAVANGMTLAQLEACAHVLAKGEIVGVEIGELEAEGPGSRDAEQPARLIVDALDPLFRRITT